MQFVNLNLALSAFSLFQRSSMLTLRPIDPVAIEKRLESPDSLVISASASTIDATDVDDLPPRGESPTGRNQPRFIGTSGSCRRSDPLNRIHQTAEDLQGTGLTAELTGVPVMQLEIR